MAIHINIGDPKYLNAAEQILRRHDNFEPEANITSAVRDFLILTGLARSEEMIEENPPSDASRRAVDLTALDTFIEFKRRIGTASGSAPNPQYVEQLDDYLTQSESRGRVRMGVLTDGKRWLLRWPSFTTSVQGGMWGDARMAARRLAWERLARSLLSCVSSSHRSNSVGPNRSRGSISRTTR